jgi:predicted DNA-binding transcriptional regulator AlpA
MASSTNPIVWTKPGALQQEDAANYVSLSLASFKTRVQTDPDFPKPVQLGPRRVAFLTDELDAWLQSRPRSALLPPEGCGYGRAGKPAAASN